MKKKINEKKKKKRNVKKGKDEIQLRLTLSPNQRPKS